MIAQKIGEDSSLQRMIRLVESADALERLAGVKRIAFDETGTLTCGKPSVSPAENCLLDVDRDGRTGA